MSASAPLDRFEHPSYRPMTPGERMYLVSTTDEHTRLQPRATGTVLHVDDAGTVHVRFDTGETLGLILGADVWRPLHPRWDPTPMQRVTVTAEARRERGRLRSTLADLLQADASRSEIEQVRTRIQELNAFIQDKDGHQ